MDSAFHALMKRQPALRRKAVLALGKKSFGKSFLLLCEVLKQDPSPVIRHEAAFILGATKKQGSGTNLNKFNIDRQI